MMAPFSEKRNPEWEVTFWGQNVNASGWKPETGHRKSGGDGASDPKIWDENEIEIWDEMS